MGKRGPKPAYERLNEEQKGAPLLNVRLNPPVYNHIKAQPGGARPYIERLVTEDAERTGEPLGSVPGQTQIVEGSGES